MRGCVVDGMGERILQRLRDLKLRRSDLARAADVSASAVTQWVKGDTTPDTENLDKLAQILNVSADWLLNGSEAEANVEVALIGAVSLGGRFRRFNEQEQRKVRNLPVAISRPSVAVRVDDDTMAPVYRRGDLLILEYIATSPNDCLGHDALVAVAGDSGRELLRRVMPGTNEGVFSLEAYNGSAVEAEIVTARRVLARTLALAGAEEI